MQTYLDNADKELLANKLKQLFALGQDNTNIYNALLQVQDLFNSFDIKINYEAKEIKEVKDILLIQIDHMGDAVLSSAFIRELRCNYPKANIEIIVAKDWAHLMNRCPYVNKVISVDTTNGLNVIDVINFCSNNLWDIQYDLAINLNWEYNSAALLINFFSAAINRIGYPSNTFEMYCSDLYYDREMYKRRRELDKFFYTYMVINPFDMVDEVERKLWILSSMNLKIKSNKTEVWFNDEDVDYVKQFINSKKRNIILGLGGRSLNTRYSVGKLALSLVNNKIDNENNCYCVIGPNDTTAKGNVFSEYKMKTDYEEPEGELLVQALNDEKIEAVNVINKTTLPQLCALISLSDIYIGNDTGPMHIANALNKSIIVISREAVEKENDHPGYLSSYARFLKNLNNAIVLRPEYCLDSCLESPCYGGCSAEVPHCINSVTPDEISNTIKQIINKKNL